MNTRTATRKSCLAPGRMLSTTLGRTAGHPLTRCIAANAMRATTPLDYMRRLDQRRTPHLVGRGLKMRRMPRLNGGSTGQTGISTSGCKARSTLQALATICKLSKRSSCTVPSHARGRELCQRHQGLQTISRKFGGRERKPNPPRSQGLGTPRQPHAPQVLGLTRLGLNASRSLHLPGRALLLPRSRRALTFACCREYQ